MFDNGITPVLLFSDTFSYPWQVSLDSYDVAGGQGGNGGSGVAPAGPAGLAFDSYWVYAECC